MPSCPFQSNQGEEFVSYMSIPQITITQRAKRVLILRDGHPILEGVATNGQFRLRFTAFSGASAELFFKGQAKAGVFCLEGNGTVYIGDMALHKASVKAELSGIKITSRAKWSKRTVLTRFEMGQSPSSWYGTAVLSESLQCLVTNPEKLRIVMAFKHSGVRKLPVRCVVRASLDSLDLEVSFHQRLVEVSNGSFAKLRNKLLRVLTDEITRELVVTEAQYSSSGFDDYLIPSSRLPFSHDNVNIPGFLGDSRSSTAQSRLSQGTWVTRSAADGYLATSRNSVGRKNTVPIGYLSGQEPLIYQRPSTGYINVGVRSNPSLEARGNSDANPSARYSNSGLRPDSYLQGGRATSHSRSPSRVPQPANAGLLASMEEQCTHIAGTDDMQAADISASVVGMQATKIETIAYRILRAKDILLAIEGLRDVNR